MYAIRSYYGRERGWWCRDPFSSTAVLTSSVRRPNQLNLKILHQNPPQLNPNGEAFNYAEEFKTLDLQAVKT